MRLGYKDSSQRQCAFFDGNDDCLELPCRIHVGFSLGLWAPVHSQAQVSWNEGRSEHDAMHELVAESSERLLAFSVIHRILSLLRLPFVVDRLAADRGVV